MVDIVRKLQSQAMRYFRTCEKWYFKYNTYYISF